MSSRVRTLHVLGTTALDSLRQRAQAALDAWAAEWVGGRPSGSALRLSVSAASDGGPSAAHEDQGLFEAIRTEAGGLWLRCGVADRLTFGAAVVGSELMSGSAFADDWIAGAVDRAWQALHRTLHNALLDEPPAHAPPSPAAELPAGVWAVGSGAVRFRCDELGLHAVADSAVLRWVAPIAREPAHRLPKIVPLNRAARRATARIDVMLGSVDVDLPQLLDLRCGDVLRLPQRLDQRLLVLCEGKPMARGAVGEAQGRKCIQVFANPQ